MKALIPFASLALLAVVAGCQSHKSQPVSEADGLSQVAESPAVLSPQDASNSLEGLKPTIIEQGRTEKFSYVIESVPNQQLTATSREGDKSAAVYSTNIIGIIVKPNNGAPANDARLESK